MTKKPTPAVGQKFDSGKLRYDLLDPYALAWLAAALTYGTIKYDADNWRKFSPAELRERYYAALQRHLEEWRMGQDFDPETGLPVLGLASFSLMVLVATFAPRNLADVRARTAEAIRRWRARTPTT